jgi:hypothetical protein
MNLDSIIIDNLNFLCDLDDKNKYKVINNRIVEDNDNFHDVNSPKIEYLIVNTLLFSLYSDFHTLTEKRNFLHKINISLTNIYENEFLNLIIQKSSYFNESLTKIDELYDYNFEKYNKNYCNIFWINFNVNLIRFLNYSICTCKTIHYTTMKINGMISSDEEDIEEEEEEDNSDESYEELDIESSDNDDDDKKTN